MEKYGFVYIWRDRKQNRYYVGSHWGTDDDGYVCSSNWMKQAYFKRPQDFKRRIIKRVTSDRRQLYIEETRYLQMMKPEELRGARYYNFTTRANHWTAYVGKESDVRSRISKAVKEKHNDPSYKAKMRAVYDARIGTVASDETRAKKSTSMKATMAEKFPVEGRAKKLTAEERFEYYSQKGKATWANRTDEERAAVGAKISEANIGLQNRLGKTNSPEHRRKISEAQRGRPLSEEHRMKLHGPRRKRTEEERKAQSERVKASWARRKRLECA